MILQDSKGSFYYELEQKIATGEILSQEFKKLIKDNSAEEIEQNSSGFYELCMKFADISLNAVKMVDKKTCDVKACFQYKDSDIAKAEFHNYIKEHGLSDIAGVLEAIHLMHRMAVAWDDPRCKGGIVHPDNYDWQFGFAGKYHDFCELPDDIWEQIKAEILNECK